MKLLIQALDLLAVSDYAIGDVQGCYEPLQRLLEHLNFDDNKDRLWFVGDLVNRGPESLAVLRFINSLKIKPKITLGNHDLHLLGLIFGNNSWKNKDDTLEQILKAPDAEQLGHSLRQQALLHSAPEFNLVMCHAGIAPMWDLAKAKLLATELEQVLSGPDYHLFLRDLHGNEPSLWSDNLIGNERLRAIVNYFTRMRFCDHQGRMNLSYKGTLEKAPKDLYPWYDIPGRVKIEEDIIFGHWSALMGNSVHPGLYALDTGCIWGGPLTALRLQDRKKFSVPGMKHKL